jgi:hypothetical protein
MWLPDAAPIPFRTAPAVDAGTYGTTFALTAVLLLACAGVLYVARRKGWAGVVPTGAKSTGDARAAVIEHLASRRLSAGTTVFAIKQGERHFLIVESSRGTHASIVPMDGPVSAGAGEP